MNLIICQKVESTAEFILVLLLVKCEKREAKERTVK